MRIHSSLLAFVFALVPIQVSAEGAELYAEYCLQCHGENAAMLKEFSGSRDRFREILEGDTEDMPDFYGVFDPEEIDALYDYVTAISTAEEDD